MHQCERLYQLIQLPAIKLTQLPRVIKGAVFSPRLNLNSLVRAASIKLVFINVTNDDDQKREILMRAFINTSFMDAAPLQVNFKFNLGLKTAL